MAKNTWMRIALFALVLVQLVQGQPVFAETVVAATTITTTDTPPAIIETAPATVQDVLLNVCEANGYGQDCAKTLLGMVWIESTNRFDVVGDRGAALGYFQIHYKVHKISADCATDLVCSANWTIQYLERNHYPTYKSYAVQCHNSCNAGNGYAARALYHGERLWNEPLTVTQTAPIVLMAMPTETTTS